MQERFWRIVAVVVCAALLYIGHGLHGTQPLSVPSLENRAEAGGIAWDPDYPEMFTVSDDGRTIYTWKRFKDVREGKIVVQYIGRTAAPFEPQVILKGQKIRQPQMMPVVPVPLKPRDPEPPIRVAPALPN